LDEPQQFLMAHPPGPSKPNEPEFPVIKDAVWVVGTFVSHHAYLTQSRRTIYTEINLRVDHGFPNPIVRLRNAEILDVGHLGGAVRDRSGKVLTFALEPSPLDFQVGHSYLVLLSYQPSGEFYLPVKRWDVTSGVVKPDEASEFKRARQGNSAIANRPLADAVRAVESELAAQKRGAR